MDTIRLNFYPVLEGFWLDTRRLQFFIYSRFGSWAACSSVAALGLIMEFFTGGGTSVQLQYYYHERFEFATMDP